MCGCAEALVRAVVAFFEAFLVDCFLFWFRRRRRPGPDSPASAHRDPLVPKDWTGEALPASDEEKGVIVMKAVTGRRGGFGTRPMIESMLSPPWKDLFSLMIVLRWKTM
ncbi:hypothetical protein VPH35_056362 [Triticum aestivum]